VRTFIALVAIDGAHPKLMPDLTASVDVEIARENGALVVPRDALASRGEDQIVRVRRGETFEEQRVVVGAMNNYQAVIVSGLEEGAVVARHVNGADGR
jgi:hypothetical protein